MQIEIQEYTDQHLETLQEMFVRFWDDLISKDTTKSFKRHPRYGEIYTAELLKRLRAEDGLLWFACIEGVPQGFVAAVPLTQSAISRLELGDVKGARVLELYVEAPYRSQGIGAHLMEKIEAHYRARGIDYLDVDVFAPNTRAHELYKKLGFDDWCVVLRKPLS